MKKKGLALLLACSLIFGNAANVTSYAAEVQKEDTTNEVSEEVVQDEINPEAATGNEETAEESKKNEEQDAMEAEESQESTAGEQFVDEHNVNVVDKDGNVTFVDMSGDHTIVEEALQARAVTEQIVNFRKTSGVINYTEVGTGAEGYVAGTYGADAAYLGTSGGKVKFMLGGVIGQVDESKVQVIAKSSAKSVSHYEISGGRLYHYISTNVNVTNYGSTLDNGPAP